MSLTGSLGPGLQSGRTDGRFARFRTTAGQSTCGCCIPWYIPAIYRSVPDLRSWSEVTPPSAVTVWSDPNPEVGRLHVRTPDGWIIRVVRARQERTAGFRPGGMQ
jgi:hypothetical protein